MASVTAREGSAVERVRTKDNVDLAVHSWSGPDPQAVVVYIHGIQSHGGWLWETGPELARRGIALVVADRRGAGQSGGARHDAASYTDWLDDYALVVDWARTRFPALPLTTFGQSFGASVLAGLLAREPSLADRVVFCTPALGQNRVKLSPEELSELRTVPQGTDVVPVRLKDEWYTDDPRYLEFMRSDERMMRTMTRRFRSAMVQLEDSYMERTGWLDRPTAFISVEADPIIRRDAARAAARAISKRPLVDIEMPFHLHYLEFSPQRGLFIELVAALAKGNA